MSRSVALAVPAASLAGSARRPPARAIHSLRHDPATLLGAAFCLTILLLAVFAEQLAPRDPARLDVPVRLQGPSATYLLGTDELGRDVLSRVIYGARVSLAVAGVAVSIASAIGVLLGLCAGYYGGITDSFIMRGLDGLLAFPSVILALAIMAVFGTTLVNAMIAIGIVSIPGFARIIRGGILSLKGQEFVEAARVCGATDGYLMGRVLLPHCLSPLLVQASVSFASAILVEAALSFLGLGVQPPTPSWGAMLDTGRKYLDQTPWYSASAGAAIFLTVLSLNLLGDGLRDALDPRLHRRA